VGHVRLAAGWIGGNISHLLFAFTILAVVKCRYLVTRARGAWVSGSIGTGRLAMALPLWFYVKLTG